MPEKVKLENLGKTIRSLSHRLLDEFDDGELPAYAGELLADSKFLLIALVKMVEGMPLPKAFGHPGDWGYGNEIGVALADLYKTWNQEEAPCPKK